MAEISNEDLYKIVKSIENKVITLQTMLLALAQKTGFTEEDILTTLEELKPKVMTLDPSPVEVDPETVV